MLAHPRAVVVGTGNVALDVARVLTSDPAALAGTDIADHALDALRAATVREVVLLARRGPAEAAYSAPELLALRSLPGVELVVDDHDPSIGAAIDTAQPRSHAALLQGLPRVRPDYTAQPGTGRRIVLRFGSTTARVRGDDHVDGVVLADGTELAAGLLVTSIGYGGHPIPGLPFGDGVIPNDRGRVVEVPGAYAVGWCKRGSSGGIGDNRTDAAETVRTLLDDAVAGRLPNGARGAKRFARAVARSHPDVVDRDGLNRILLAEADRGRVANRPAAKFATVRDLVRASRK